MNRIKAIFGACLVLLSATVALGETPVETPAPPSLSSEARSLNGVDAADMRDGAAIGAIAIVSPTVRPAVRPVHMLRYPVDLSKNPTLRPVLRGNFIPDTRWDFREDSDSWTRAALLALRTHGSELDDTVPRDIATWCPAYPQNPPHLRRAFWVGLLSALVKHESTYRPAAVGGGNRWFGLMQIFPDTARRYGCRATTGEGLKDPEDNLSCAIRIMSVTVPRDNAISVRDNRWRGIAADWAPMTNSSKIAEMAAWTRRQTYCESRGMIRPQARPPVRTPLVAPSDDLASDD